MKKTFPKKFYWGAAAASYQVEGGNDNTDWAKAATEGRVPECGRACDHYHLFEKDFDLAKSLGHNAHRLSIEWARIEPEEGKFNEEEIAHYREVLKALRARDIEPFVTLWHFTLPLWFSEGGGFERKDAPDIFARYCAYAVENLGDLCDNFATINEPMVFATNGWLRGTWAPFKRFTLLDHVAITDSGRKHNTQYQKGVRPFFLFWKVRKNLIRAHNMAYDAIKKVCPQTQVGIVHQVMLFQANWNPFNKGMAWLMNRYWTHYDMRRVIKRCDTIGLNYYNFKKFGDKKEYQKSDMDWSIYPEGIYDALMMLKRYRTPVYVTEAGIADDDDDLRPQYIRTQVVSTKRAYDDGVDVRGHMYWSLLDNYEWGLGFEKRFGLIRINYETLERTVRPSAYMYRDLILKYQEEANTQDTSEGIGE